MSNSNNGLQLTLLHFIVRAYMKKVPDPVTAPLPVPEPADIDKAGAVMFDDLTADLKKLEKQLKGVKAFIILSPPHSMNENRKILSHNYVNTGILSIAFCYSL